MLVLSSELKAQSWLSELATAVSRVTSDVLGTLKFIRIFMGNGLFSAYYSIKQCP
jgi:hypothetical protein